MDAKRRLLIVVIASILVGCSTVWGQQRSGQLIIHVTDPTGAVVPHAQIRLLPRPNTVPDNPETNEYGNLALSVPPGNYELFVSFPRFTPWGDKIKVHQDSAEKIAILLQDPADTEIVSTGDHKPIDLNSARSLQSPHPVAITIEVSDQKGLSVPFAQVWVAGEQREADEGGKLHLNLVPTAYYLTVTSPSFRRWRERYQIHARTAVIRVVLTKMDVHKVDAE